MERTEELVQNLLVAQNELILHLSTLKRVPDLAILLFGSVEKNITTEKNSLEKKKNSVDQTFSGGNVYPNHKKKFTFLDKLREDRPDLWNDTDEDIWFCYCPSEFGYEEGCTYEEGKISERCEKCWMREFKYSDTDSVNQTKKTPETCRERLQREHPDEVRDRYVGGCKGCPTDHGYIPKEKIVCLGDRPHEVHGEQRCTLCWDQPYNP